MKAAHATLLGRVILAVTMLMAGRTSFAQQPEIPFGQIEHASQFSAWAAVPLDRNADSSSASGAPFESAVSLPVEKTPRTLSTKYFMLNGLHLGLAVFDVEMTQRCIAAHQCREGNPLMPSSFAGQLAVNLAFVSYGSFTSYRMKKHGSSLWWISPVVGAASHAAGAATGFAHR